MSAPLLASTVSLPASVLKAALAPCEALADKQPVPGKLVHLEAESVSTLTLRTNNGRMEAFARLNAEVSERFSVTLEAAPLGAVVGKLAPAQPVTLTAKGATLLLTQGKRRVTLPVYPAADVLPGGLFPEDVRVGVGRGAWCSVPRARLRSLLSAVRRSMCRDDARPAMYGAHLFGAGDWIAARTFDGHRALMVREHCAGIGDAAGGTPPAWAAILAPDTVERWFKLLSGSKADACELRVSRATPSSAPLPSFAALPAWSALDAISQAYGPDGGADRLALRVEGVSLAALTVRSPMAPLGAILEAQDPTMHVRARVDARATAKALGALFITTADENEKAEKVYPRLDARADATGLYLTTRALSGELVGVETEEHVEALVASAGFDDERHAAANIKYLADAFEVAAELAVDPRAPEDVDLAWRMVPQGERVGSTWVVHPTGHTREDAPWIVLVQGFVR